MGLMWRPSQLPRSSSGRCSWGFSPRGGADPPASPSRPRSAGRWSRGRCSTSPDSPTTPPYSGRSRRSSSLDVLPSRRSSCRSGVDSRGAGRALAAGGLALGAALAVGRRPDGDLPALVAALAASLLLTPILWPHYLAILLVPLGSRGRASTAFGWRRCRSGSSPGRATEALEDRAGARARGRGRMECAVSDAGGGADARLGARLVASSSALSYESSAPTWIVGPANGAGRPSTGRCVRVAGPPQRWHTAWSLSTSSA